MAEPLPNGTRCVKCGEWYYNVHCCPKSTSPAPVVAEPVLFQFRTRPDWIEQWGEWTNCTAGSAADYERTPVLHDWHYEVRRLYLAAPLAEGPTDEMRARANEIASMARPEYFNRVRSMVLALAAPLASAPPTSDLLLIDREAAPRLDSGRPASAPPQAEQEMK